MKGLRLASLIVSFSLIICSCLFVRADGKEDIPEYFEKSFTYEEAGDNALSLKEMLKVLRIDESNYTANLRAGWLSYRTKDYGGSIKHYRKAISLAPDAVEPLIGLTLPLMALSRWKEAESAEREALKKDESNYYLNIRLAYTLYYRRKYAQAADQYSKVLKLYPSDTQAQAGLGWSYFWLGKKETARKYFREALTMDPSYRSAIEGMAALRQGEKMPSKAPTNLEPKGACCFIVPELPHHRVYWCGEGYTQDDCLALTGSGGYYAFANNCSECRNK